MFYPKPPSPLTPGAAEHWVDSSIFSKTELKVGRGCPWKSFPPPAQPLRICPPAFFNTAQKLLGVGKWNFVTFSINVQHILSNSFWSPGTLGCCHGNAISKRRLAKSDVKSSPKPLFEPKIRIIIQFWIPVSNLILIRWEIKKSQKNLSFDGRSGLKLEMTS